MKTPLCAEGTRLSPRSSGRKEKYLIAKGEGAEKGRKKESGITIFVLRGSGIYRGRFGILGGGGFRKERGKNRRSFGTLFQKEKGGEKAC